MQVKEVYDKSSNTSEEMVEKVMIEDVKNNSFDRIRGVSKNSSDEVRGVNMNYSDKSSKEFTKSIECT